MGDGVLFGTERIRSHDRVSNLLILARRRVRHARERTNSAAEEVRKKVTRTERPGPTRHPHDLSASSLRSTQQTGKRESVAEVVLTRAYRPCVLNHGLIARLAVSQACDKFLTLRSRASRPESAGSNPCPFSQYYSGKETSVDRLPTAYLSAACARVGRRHAVGLRTDQHEEGAGSQSCRRCNSDERCPSSGRTISVSAELECPCLRNGQGRATRTRPPWSADARKQRCWL